MASNTKAVVLSTLSAVQDFEAMMDAATGYPRNGVDQNGGLHAPDEISDTAHISRYYKHLTLPLYAYIVWDDILSAIPEGYSVTNIDLADYLPQDFM